MVNNPLVSIILPVYNAEKYLFMALESLIVQSYKNIEIIIINDGSTDKSLEIINSFKKKDSRIKLIDRKNMGLAYSLNEGIFFAKGNFIARMDADDISKSDRIEKQVNYILKNSFIDILGTNVDYIDVFSRKIGESNYPLSNMSIKNTLPFWCCLAHPSIFGKKEIFLSQGGYQSKYRSEDYELWLRICRNKNIQFGNMAEKLLKYRIHNLQVTDKKNLRLIVKDNISLKMRELLLTKNIIFIFGVIRDIFSFIFSIMKYIIRQ
ncbi:MAG: glycosyltransferase [Candidatus Phlomobacter fragariae]